MRKVYLDCGTWVGDSIVGFKKYFRGSDSYDIYAFECEPRLYELLTRLSTEYKFEFINKAVWINDLGIDLYPGVEDMTQSSSVLIEKKKFIDKDKPIHVQTIDFSQWILDTFKQNDYIVCKMNIEGAEYDVLEKMIQDKSLQYIDKLYVAWHNKKLEGFSEDRHNKIKKEITNITDLSTWNFVESEGKNPF